MTSKLQGYSTIGTNNKEAAEIFYDGLLAQINAKKFPANDRITMWLSEDGNSVVLAIAKPYDGGTASHGNGTMKAIALDSHEEVDKMYEGFMRFGDTLSSVKKAITNADTEIDLATKRLNSGRGNLKRRAEKIRELSTQKGLIKD